MVHFTKVVMEHDKHEAYEAKFEELKVEHVAEIAKMQERLDAGECDSVQLSECAQQRWYSLLY